MRVNHEDIKLTPFERVSIRFFEPLGYTMRVTNVFGNHCFWLFERDGLKMPNVLIERNHDISNSKNYLKRVLKYLEQYERKIKE